jgi:superfamily II DNA or RNA helicase
MNKILARDRVWNVGAVQDLGNGKKLLSLLSRDGSERLKILSPPETYELLPETAPQFARTAVAPWSQWLQAHAAIKLANVGDGQFAALHAGRILPEPYQFAPVEKLLRSPRNCLLIADDVGVGKTVEAGISLLELIGRGRAKRILLIVPPGLIGQWQEEMLEKFGLAFTAIENAASLEQVQTRLSEGIKPWSFLNRVITSVEYLKKREVLHSALESRWDAIVVDEAHYLAESGTPKNPYRTARFRLGERLRDACHALLLLTATPHNGYSHSFRSLLEMIEPTDATFAGDKVVVNRRVSRNIIRRLKPQIFKTVNGEQVPAFKPREPVKQIAVTALSDSEKSIFTKVSSYCARTAREAAKGDEAELVSFAMQIIKKRMLSSRTALAQTVAHRLEALGSRQQADEPPTRGEVRELQADLPLSEAAHERIASRIIRSALPKEASRRTAEKRQLNEIKRLLEGIASQPDPKIAALIADIERDVLSVPGEKAIVFTEYLDTLGSIRTAFQQHAELKDEFVELTGGLSRRQREARIAQFEKQETRFLLATDAASEGLNLQHYCRRVYHFELPWNPNRLEQRNGRVDRHGQTRSPIIRYLFYPDSPEDNVLDRLVRRIVQMQEDKVSTPDILGIVSGARIEQALTLIDADERDTKAEENLFCVFDDNYAQFVVGVAPLLTVREVAYGNDKLDLHSLSADPLLEDDDQLEKFMLQRLGEALRPAEFAESHSLRTPPELRGPGVLEIYPAITFRRSVAMKYPARDVEFVSRLHPLFSAIVQEAYATLTGEHSPNAPSSRLAVRRHPMAKKPYAVFTFAETAGSTPVRLVSVGIDAGAKLIADVLVGAAFDRSASPGEVQWETVSRTFEKTFPHMEIAAAEAAQAKLRAQAEADAGERAKVALVLREDAEQYRADRLQEIELEEKTARVAEEASQVLLFETRTATGFQARRAAVETHLKKRLEEITEFERPRDPGTPQPLGVLFVFPTNAS